MRTGLTGLVPLALRLHWAHRSRFALLAVLTAVTMSVFLIVTELSRVSSTGLDEAIAADVGETGTYAIDLGSDLGLPVDQLARVVAVATHRYAARPLRMVEVLPPVQPECPPYQQLGPHRIQILRDGDGQPVSLPFGHDLPVESEFCLDGQQIPAAALYIPTEGEQRTLGTGIFVEPTYRPVMLAATTGPATYRFVVVTLRQADARDAIHQAVSSRLHEDAVRHGILDDGYVTVSRVDSAGDIRSASEGIKLVYLIIAWAVVILGGLGLLVAELIVVRNRSWFYGLARAIGARNGHIAALILADLVLILAAGTILALLLAALVQPAADGFAQSAFALHVQLVQPSSIFQLATAGLLVLLLAGTYPAAKAIRADPLDVLEPRSP